MEIRLFHFSTRIKTDYNGNAENLGWTVKLEEGETEEQVAQQLREKAIAIIGRPASDLYNDRDRAKKQLEEVSKKLADMRAKYKEHVAWLNAAGIPHNLPPLPQMVNLLNSSKPEQVCEVELVDPDAPESGFAEEPDEDDIPFEATLSRNPDDF
ncbi:MAG TPA: hypothetical protein VK203_06110 [Nostocaceae cyanobacterium]|nr:hypothetical protein [Nostocaceae cyanobacterium]